MPASFRGVDMPNVMPTRIWAPLALADRLGTLRDTNDWNDRERRWVLAKGRLAAGRSVSDARTEIEQIGRNLDASVPIGSADRRAYGRPEDVRRFAVTRAADLHAHDRSIRLPCRPRRPCSPPSRSCCSSPARTSREPDPGQGLAKTARSGRSTRARRHAAPGGRHAAPRQRPPGSGGRTGWTGRRTRAHLAPVRKPADRRRRAVNHDRAAHDVGRARYRRGGDLRGRHRLRAHSGVACDEGQPATPARCSHRRIGGALARAPRAHRRAGGGVGGAARTRRASAGAGRGQGRARPWVRSRTPRRRPDRLPDGRPRRDGRRRGPRRAKPESPGAHGRCR